MKPFTALDRIILFDNEQPYIAWVAQVTSVTFMRYAEQFVCVSYTEHDAHVGEYRQVRAQHIQPYTDARWAACEAWIERKHQLVIDFNRLRDGEVS